MLCVPTPPLFVYDIGAFGFVGQPLSRMLRKTAITEFLVTSLVCFIQTAEFGVPDLFVLNSFHELQEERCK